MDVNTFLFSPVPFDIRPSSHSHHGLLVERIWRMQMIANRPITAGELSKAINWSLQKLNSVMVQVVRISTMAFDIVATGKGANRTYLINVKKFFPGADLEKWGITTLGEKTASSALDKLLS